MIGNLASRVVYRKDVAETQMACESQSGINLASHFSKQVSTIDHAHPQKRNKIEWGDCDPFGIVFYPRYFEYFDACTNALFHRALGYPKVESASALSNRWNSYGANKCQLFCAFQFRRYRDGQSLAASAGGTSSFSVEHKLFRGETLAVGGIREARMDGATAG